MTTARKQVVWFLLCVLIVGMTNMYVQSCNCAYSVWGNRGNWNTETRNGIWSGATCAKVKSQWSPHVNGQVSSVSQKWCSQKWLHVNTVQQVWILTEGDDHADSCPFIFPSYIIWTFQIFASILAKVPFPVWDYIHSIPHSVPTFLLSQIGVFDGFVSFPLLRYSNSNILDSSYWESR